VSASRGTSRQDPATARLAGWIEPVVGAAGYDLEELVVTPAGRRSVVTLDDIAEVSKAVSAVLDENDGDLGRSPYVLEVTSPGVDRPLTEPRHWRRNTGRLVTVSLGPDAGNQVTGRITAVDDDGVTLAVEAPGKPGAKKRPPTPHTVAWRELGAGRVQVEFGRHDSDHHHSDAHDVHADSDDHGDAFGPDDDGGGE
jgi:ribosome maturation factor RimP